MQGGPKTKPDGDFMFLEPESQKTAWAEFLMWGKGGSKKKGTGKTAISKSGRRSVQALKKRKLRGSETPHVVREKKRERGRNGKSNNKGPIRKGIDLDRRKKNKDTGKIYTRPPIGRAKRRRRNAYSIAQEKRRPISGERETRDRK